MNSDAFDKLLQATDRPRQLALATVNNTLLATAHERCDTAYERGHPSGYRPDWGRERKALAEALEPYTEGDVPTERQMQRYKNEWARRFELAHEKGHTNF